MANQGESPIAVSWPGLVAFLVAALGLIVSRPPLESARPAAAPWGGDLTAAGGGVPARLWQDPLAVAYRGRPPADDIASVVKRFRPSDDPSEKDKPVLFLFNFLPSDGSLESAERRRRDRYAILSALSTAGYAPADSERIYYASLTDSGRTYYASLTDPVRLIEMSTFLLSSLRLSHYPFELVPALNLGRGVGGTERSDGKEKGGMRLPYEWVQPLDKRTRGYQDSATTDPVYQSVCVLWISPPADFKGSLFQLLAWLRGSLEGELRNSLTKGSPKGQEPPQCRFAITGRIGSSQLDGLLREKVSVTDPSKPVPLYVTYSTAPYVRGETKAKKKELMCESLTKGIQIEYVIGTDDLLVRALVKELESRGLPLRERDGVRMAVIAEWDTEYGRQMHSLFDSAIPPPPRDSA
jgi:hypothetical protein